MSLMNKIKAGAEQARELGEKAAAKAKEEARELQVKRELDREEGELGRKAFALAHQGAITHPELDEHLTRIRELMAELEQLAGPAEPDAGEPIAEAGSEERPRSNVPPAMPS